MPMNEPVTELTEVSGAVKRPRQRRLRWAARGIAAWLAVCAGVMGWRWGSGNQGEVVAGAVYRSGQLSAVALGEQIRTKGIKTVVNLRGPNPRAGWYRAEREAVLRGGAALVDLPLASDLWLSREQAEVLLEVLESSERPVWIHCEFGSERTGLAAAIVALLQPGSGLGDGDAQFGPGYLYLPTKDGRVMRAHLEAYKSWLGSAGLGHTPERFREWWRRGYVPGRPSREEWPYDPYPLKVVTRPGKAGEATWSRRKPAPGVRVETVDPFGGLAIIPEKTVR
jgi:protein tyrosine phosphatase (PTP) superfamily phosphohydrolase (DUF442 family)